MDDKFDVRLVNNSLSANINDNSVRGVIQTASGVYYINFGLAMVDEHNHNALYYTKQEIDSRLTNSGIMYQNVYDADRDGVVDIAGAVPWSGIIGVPSDFPPSQHNHDNIYYTKNEVNTFLQAKADINHVHDDRYVKIQDFNLVNAGDVNITQPNQDQALLYDASTGKWTNKTIVISGGGDMYKAIYDQNNDGIVDVASSVDWSGIANKPLTFDPSPHSHQLSDISGHDKVAHDSLSIDADTVDGKHASEFSISGHLHDDRYVKLQDFSLPNLSGVQIVSPQNNQVLMYDQGASVWKNASIPAGGDMYKAVYDTNNNGIVDVAESVEWSGILNKPLTFPPDVHNHDNLYYTKQQTDSLLDQKASVSHTHAINDLTDVQTGTLQDGDVLAYNTVSGVWVNKAISFGDMYKSVYDTNNDGVVDLAESVDWSGIQNKPLTFPPSTHTHPLSDVTGHDKASHDALNINADTVDGKHASDFSDVSHNHDDRYYTEIELSTSGAGGQVHWDNVINKPNTYPPAIHTHSLNDVIDHNKAAHDALNINADTVDGQHASAFAQAVHTHTPGEVGLGNVTNDAQLKRAGNDFTSFTEKITPSDNDVVLSEDSSATYAKKKITLGNIYLWLKSRFDSLYAALGHNHDASYYTKTQLNTSGAGGAVHWDNVTSKPSSYPPSTHQHAAGDITSGIFDVARIPNLDASKIVSGTLSTDRFSAYDDLQAENYFGFGSTQIARNIERAVGIRAVRNTAQSIPNASWTRIVLNTLISESKPASMPSQWDSVNGHFVVRQSGWYALFAAATFDTNATGYRFVGIAKNNSVTNTLVNSGIMALSGVASCIAVSTVAYLVAGDTVSLWVIQNSGGNLNVVYLYENWMYLAMVLLFPA
jgi:hypothetical protein